MTPKIERKVMTTIKQMMMIMVLLVAAVQAVTGQTLPRRDFIAVTNAAAGTASYEVPALQNGTLEYVQIEAPGHGTNTVCTINQVVWFRGTAYTNAFATVTLSATGKGGTTVTGCYLAPGDDVQLAFNTAITGLVHTVRRVPQ